MSFNGHTRVVDKDLRNDGEKISAQQHQWEEKREKNGYGKAFCVTRKHKKTTNK